MKDIKEKYKNLIKLCEKNENLAIYKKNQIEKFELDNLYNYLKSFDAYIIPEKKEKWNYIIKNIIYDKIIENVYDYKNLSINNDKIVKINYKEDWYDYINSFITAALLIQACDMIYDSEVFKEIINNNFIDLYSTILIEILILEFAPNGYELTSEFYNEYSILDYQSQPIKEIKNEAKLYSESRRKAEKELLKSLKKVLRKKENAIKL